MERSRTIDAFVANPIGAHYVGATYLIWCASETLCGSAHWGQPSEDDIRQLTRLFDIMRHPLLRRVDVYMDNGAVELLGWRALGVLSDHLKMRLSEWGERIRKQAVVLPSGVGAVILAGVVPLLGPTYPMRFVSSRGAALEWLERDDAHVVVDEVERLVSEARGVTPLVRELRAYLDGALVNASVGDAARVLRRSRRVLQRELREAGTGFGVELTRARVRAACMMLAHSEEKVESIARTVGCLTSSRLSTLFRHELGETPLRYRERHKPT